MLWPTATVVATLSLFGFILNRSRALTRELASSSEQISRAHELISRYVAAQVSQRILSGDYEAVTRPARRRLTVFFSDIKDFTATTEQMEPEDLSQILNEYLTEMTRIAEKHEGTIDKFVGDAIMIFFGAPDATTDKDHALRAVRMAVEMQERMVSMRQEWREQGIRLPFHVRMGVNTGLVSIGNFGSEGRMDYTAIGRQVNLAARLEVTCEPDKVLISEATWAFVKDEIPCTAKGVMQAKGMRDPVSVYEVAAGEKEQVAAGKP
jgi:class 3 adenylate cyclase